MKLQQYLFLGVTIGVWLVTLCSTIRSADAFSTVSSRPRASSPQAELSTSSLNASSRRGVLGKLRGAILGGAGFSAFRQRSEAASAEDIPASTDGRKVELQVANVDGVEGKTGTVKIQLRPEWAPRGVKRFEVSTAPEIASAGLSGTSE